MRRNTIIEEDLEDIFSRDIPWECMENKTILITGAYGMLASYMMFMLIYLNEKKGMHIKLIALVRSMQKFEKKFGKVANYPYLKVYIDSLDKRLEIEEDIHYFIHAASLASPQYYSVCPVEVLKPNVVGTYHLLELASEKKAEGFLLFSSSDVYGVVKDADSIREETFGAMDTMDIHNCYSESKRMAETMCNAWYHQKGVPTKIVRIWHTYAPTMDIENDPRVFASFVNDIVHNQNIVMNSDGSAMRSFCYISDAVAGYFTVLLRGESGQAYNVCNSEAFCSIRNLAKILTNLYPEKGLQVVRKDRKVGDTYVENTVANYIPPDNSKLRSLGWYTSYDISEGFKRVIESFDNTNNTQEI